MSERPTDAQLKVLRTMREMGASVQVVTNGAPPFAFIRRGGEGDLFLRVPTIEGLEKRGLLTRHVEWEGKTDLLQLNDDAYCEIEFADGKYQISMRCSECKQIRPVRRETFRECRRNEMGIICFPCSGKIFVAGEQQRRAALAAAASEGGEARP